MSPSHDHSASAEIDPYEKPPPTPSKPQHDASAVFLVWRDYLTDPQLALFDYRDRCAAVLRVEEARTT